MHKNSENIWALFQSFNRSLIQIVFVSRISASNGLRICKQDTESAMWDNYSLNRTTKPKCKTSGTWNNKYIHVHDPYLCDLDEPAALVLFDVQVESLRLNLEGSRRQLLLPTRPPWPRPSASDGSCNNST